MKKIILASGSPRRRELLGLVTDNFTVAPSRDIDESYPDTLAPDQVPVFLSQLKARGYDDLTADGSIVLTADTVVIVDEQILGKPAGRDEAIAMLRMLSGRAHRVVTGVTLHTADRSASFATTTTVHFAPLTDSEIEHYVDTYRPFDKAGAYGIQEWIGAIGITGIEGCFYNVMGLPLHDLYRHLKEFK